MWKWTDGNIPHTLTKWQACRHGNTNEIVTILKMGSGALPGLMLDLGLLKIICEDVFPLSSYDGVSNTVRPYPNPFTNPVGLS